MTTELNTITVCDQFGNIIEMKGTGFAWTSDQPLTIYGAQGSIATFWKPQWAVCGEVKITKQDRP